MQALQTSEHDDYSFRDLERIRQKSLPRFTSRELLELYPDAIEIIPLKIRELQEENNKDQEILKKQLAIIQEKSDPLNRWFWTDVVKYLFPETLQIVWRKKQIARLRFLHQLTTGGNSKISNWDKRVERARQVTSKDAILPHLERTRRVGNKHISLCPFHNEKTASFTIFPDGGWHCFGCQVHGNDSIAFVMKLNSVSFREAVEILTA